MGESKVFLLHPFAGNNVPQENKLPDIIACLHGSFEVSSGSSRECLLSSERPHPYQGQFANVHNLCLNVLKSPLKRIEVLLLCHLLSRFIFNPILKSLFLSGKINWSMMCFKTKSSGYLTALLTVLGFTVSGTAVQAINGTIPDLELTVFRYLGLFTISVIYLQTTHIPLKVPSNSYFHVIITSLGSGGFCLFYHGAMNYLPLSHVSAIFMSVRTIFMAVLVKVFKGEVRKSIFIGTVGCIAGILLITQPWIEIQNEFSVEHDSTHQLPFSSNLTGFSYKTITNQKTPKTLLFGCFLAVVAAVSDAWFTMTIGLFLRTIHPIVISFLSACICIPIAGLSCFYVSQPVIITDQATILLVCLHVVFSSLGLLMQAISSQLIEPVYVSIIGNLEIVTFLSPQYLLMKDDFRGHMNSMELCGCFLIVAVLVGTVILSPDRNHEDFN